VVERSDIERDVNGAVVSVRYDVMQPQNTAWGLGQWHIRDSRPRGCLKILIGRGCGTRTELKLQHLLIMWLALIPSKVTSIHNDFFQRNDILINTTLRKPPVCFEPSVFT